MSESCYSTSLVFAVGPSFLFPVKCKVFTSKNVDSSSIVFMCMHILDFPKTLCLFLIKCIGDVLSAFVREMSLNFKRDRCVLSPKDLTFLILPF